MPDSAPPTCQNGYQQPGRCRQLSGGGCAVDAVTFCVRKIHRVFTSRRCDKETTKTRTIATRKERFCVELRSMLFEISDRRRRSQNTTLTLGCNTTVYSPSTKLTDRAIYSILRGTQKRIFFSGSSSVKSSKCRLADLGPEFGGPHCERTELTYNGRLKAEPSVGSVGRAAGQGVRGEAPLNLNAFCVITACEGG